MDAGSCWDCKGLDDKERLSCNLEVFLCKRIKRSEKKGT